MSTASSLADRHRRPLGVLRLSLTGRCNLSCPYCCPDDADPPDLLTLEQQLRLIRVGCDLGVHTLRLTGGEPLLSPRLLPLLQRLAEGRATPAHPFQGLRDVALTTNGVLLNDARASALSAAGLDRITISLDAVDGLLAARMAGLRGGVEAGRRLVAQVLAGLEAARAAGFDPRSGALKLNAVVQRGVNDDQLLPLVDLARQRQVELRLIEYMDVGNRNGWSLEQVVPAAEMIQRIHTRWPLEPIGRSVGGTSHRWRFRDGGGVIGVIASITEPFCGDCNRLRVTADGQAFTCLFGSSGLDVRPHLHTDDQLRQCLVGLWRDRIDRYSEERAEMSSAQSHAEMAYLGG